ncbi:MAG: hypothetical protein IJK61_04635 [Bacteroidetes bacterium]|nr:hypothetical protein [Bacteroidota bacterium]
MKFVKKMLIIALLISIYQVKAQPIGPITTPITAYLPSELPELIDYTLFDTTDPVEPDFPNDQFKKDTCDSNKIDLGGCILEFNYYYRIAGNTYNDIYISSFSIKGDSCHILEPPYTVDEYNSIIDTIMLHIINNCNPWNDSIPPCYDNPTPPIWRLGHPACVSDPHWLYDPINQWFFYSVTSCKLNSETDICWHIVTYCWEYENGGKVIHKNTISTGVSYSICPPFLDGHPTINCNSVCE